MELVLDDYLIKHGIVDIRTIKNNIVILANLTNKKNQKQKQKRFEIKFSENPTEHEIAESLEAKLDKVLGRDLCQYIIQYICKPENFTIISNSGSRQEAEQIQTQTKSKYQYDSFEQWQISLETAYHALHKTVDDNIPQAWTAIEFVLSVKAILHIKEITLPYLGIILGPPAGVKTIVLTLLNGRPHTFFTDKFNPHAMVSHVATLPMGMKEGDQHMLNKMKNKIVLAPELASILSGREEELRESIQLLTRVADGQGLETDSGLGHKAVTGKVMFVMTGAGVEFSPMVYGMLTTFGAKLYFFRLPIVEKTHDEYLQDLKGDQFVVKVQRMKDAMNEYLDVFESCPSAELEDGLPKISLEKFRSNNSHDALDIIVYLGKLLRHLRNVTWTREYSTSTKRTTQEDDKIEITETEERDFSFNTSLFEDQGRADQQHYNLALAHALSTGRTSIAMEDIPLTVKVTLSTAPQNRHRVFELLLDKGNTLTTHEICDNLKIHRSTANRAMTELVAVGIAHWYKTGEEHSKGIELNDEFEFFTEDKFEAARQDDYRRYREYLENLKGSGQQQEENIPTDGEKEGVSQ